MKKTIVYFEVEAIDDDLTLQVIDAIGKGFKKQFGKRRVLIGTPKVRPTDPRTIILAPFSVGREVTDR